MNLMSIIIVKKCIGCDDDQWAKRGSGFAINMFDNNQPVVVGGWVLGGVGPGNGDSGVFGCDKQLINQTKEWTDWSCMGYAQSSKGD